MNLEEIVKKGAVLRLPDTSGIVLAPVVTLDNHQRILYFYDLVADRPRTLEVDTVEWIHALGAQLSFRGVPTGYLTTVAEDSPAAIATWQNVWETQPAEEQERLEEYYRDAINEVMIQDEE